MESWMPYFVLVVGIAVIVQAIVLIALFVQLRKTAARVEQTVADLNTRINPILSRVQILVDDLSPRIASIVSDASDLTTMARSQAQRLDRILTETLERTRLQLIHVDQILTGAMETVEEAGSRLRQTIWGPVVKATAVIRGIQTGLEFFRAARQSRRGNDHVEQPADQQDEGMFI
jgi:predicted PurR-regulated permease PerM